MAADWIRIGVDTGGTFTDLVVVGSRRPTRVLKVPSTPAEPSRAVIEGLRILGMLASDETVIHGTTVATNAFLQRRHGKAALVATRGFEDVLVLGRQARRELYRLDPPRLPDWIPRARRLGIDERVGPRGQVLKKLDVGSVAALVRRLRRRKVDAVAVVLLHAYANPVHEKAVAARLRGQGWHLSLSHEVAREFREYERTCTTVANAVLAAPMRAYLEKLGRKLGSKRLRVMGSSGGWMSFSSAQRLPVRTLLSGPAGGVAAAARLGRALSQRHLITLDMGGTSTDLAVCRDEVPRVSRAVLGGMPLMMPTLDIHSLGAGGGSIARCDRGGALRVGPESAGSDPGPACYGRGGTAATLTDANLVLKRLPSRGLLGGSMPLDARAAHTAVTLLGRQLGLSPQQAALGVVRVVESSLENAVRSLVAGRGLTFGDFALLVFGGAGGLHACGLARRLGIRRIIVPPDPGAFSAMGLACSPCIWESSRTVLRRSRAFGASGIAALLRPMLDEGRRQVLKESGPSARLRIRCEGDLRYAGQSHEITLPMAAHLAQRFHRAHQAAYGYARRGEDVELVTVRVRVEGPTPAFRWRPPSISRAASPAATAKPRRRPVGLARETLAPGRRLPGPLLIEEYGATTFVAPGFVLTLGSLGELILEDLSPARA
jgi:N-methylhydantoinase A